MFHLVGLYPVPSTREHLVLSPFVPSYTVYNDELGSFIVNVTKFDPLTLAENIAPGTRAYVQSVSINGQIQSSRCKIRFEQLLSGPDKPNIIELTMTGDVQAADSCGPSQSDLPSSLSTGGFDHI